MLRFFISFFAVFLITAPALASSAIEQTCKFRTALISDGSIKPTDAAKELFAWNPNLSAEKVASALSALDTFDYGKVDVFLLSRIGNYYETHLVAAALPVNSPLFFEIRYVLIGDDVRLSNIEFKDSLPKLLPNFSHGGTLTKLECDK